MIARPEIGLDSVLRLRSDVRYRLLDDEAIVVIQGRAEVLGLNPVGSRLLTLLDGRTALRGAIDRLAAEYEVEPTRLRDEVLAFGAELAEAGVLEPTLPDGTAGEPDGPVPRPSAGTT